MKKHLLLWLLILLLGGCQGETAVVASLTTPISPIIKPSATKADSYALTQTPSVTPSPPVQAQLLPVLPTASLTPSPTPQILPSATLLAVRPNQAQLLRIPSALSTDVPDEWRPPPVPVPYSLHPDDHYWLMRPIPSGNRNYDLEWYPFGNDVLVPELFPYRIHHGLDFPNPSGTPILAASSGTVIHAGPLPSPRNGINYYGNTVIIQHDWQWQGQDVFTLYAHTLEMFVQEGDWVEQGQLIAGVGSSGEVSGAHLHLEVRVGSNNYGNARNPALWVAPFEGWGTLAGKFVDRNGRPISSASITVRPIDVDTPIRNSLTYYPGVRPDPTWDENFVVADLPAGRYTLLIGINGIQYRRTVEIRAGQTSFELISATFAFAPTATPTPTPEVSPTPTTEGEEETITATPEP